MIATAPQASEGIFTIPETAKFARLGVSSVRRAMEKGELRYLKIGKSVRLTRAEIDRWLSEKLVSAS